MKKTLGLILSIVLLSWFASSQTLIKNSSKAKNNNSGRILEFEELMRITDESDEFFFKRPYSLNLDEEGFIYFKDGDFFLKFSPEGDFVKNLAHRGQGPGEVQILRYNIQGKSINVYDSRSRKVVLYDLDGKFLREFRPEQHFGISMVGHYGDSLIFSTYEMPSEEKRTGMTEVNHNLVLISKESGTETLIKSFPVPWYVLPNFGTSYAPFYISPSNNGETLFINDSPEYKIKVLNISTGEILRIFTRKYKRVKAPPPRPGSTQPERKHLYDIRYIFRNKEQIWVMTSTQDEDKGALFDVFSQMGEYLDSFYIPNEISFMYVQGNILFARNEDEDGIYSVVKYRILN